jgi:protein-serine/threonine kinase
MKGLLIKNEFNRLGSKNGASDVKNHLFFKGTRWALLRNQTPPIIPQISNPMDTCNFRTVRESVSLDFSKETLYEEAAGNPFHGFESVTLERA